MAEVILKVDMHCKGCRTKVRKCLLGFPGVECLEMDMKEQKVTIKGKFDAMKIYETVKKKSGKKTLLLSPLPTGEHKKESEAKMKEERPQMTAVFKVKMHCQGCAKEVHKAILGMDGELDVKVDALQQKVVVKGKGFDPHTICSRVARKTGKLMVYVPPPKAQQKDEKKKEANKEEKKKEESKEKKKKKEENQEEKKKEESQEEKKLEENKEEKKSEEKKEEQKKEEKKEEEKKEEKKEEEIKEEKKEEDKVEEKKKEGGNPKPHEEEEKKELEKSEEEGKSEKEEPIIIRMEELSGPKKYEYIPSRSLVHEYAYPPQLFSDENPNACSIM